MANAEAWNQGWALGSERAAEGRAHKQALSDQEFQDTHDEIQGLIDNLQTRLSTLDPSSTDYLKTKDQLAQALQQRDEHWKSLDHPNAILKFGKMLGRDLRFKKQAAPTPVAPPVYGQPTAQIPQSSDESVTLGSQPEYREKTVDANGHVVTVQQPGVQASTVSSLGATGEPPKTVSIGSAYKVQGPQTPAQVRAQAEATQLASAAPLSPEEQATEAAKASAAGSLIIFQSKLKLYDQQNPHATAPDATEEEKQARQDYIDTLLQGTTKQPVEGWTPVKGANPQKMPDGTYRELQVNKKGEYRYVQMPEGYVPPPPATKPGTSKFSVNVESYKKLHNIPPEQSLTPDQLNFVEQQIALSSAAPSSNITNTLKQDINGAWVPIQETTQRIPGFGVILRDPLGPVQDKNASSSPAETGTASTPSEVKKKAQALNPPAAAPRRAGVSVGSPLFQGQTRGYTTAQGDLNTAIGLDAAAHNAENADPSVKAGLQREIAGRLQNTLEKRFNLAAMDNLINHYGIANDFATWLTRTETGALPDNVFHEIVAMADNNVVEKKAALKSATPPPIGEGQNSSSNPDIDAIVNILNSAPASPAH